MKKCKAGLTLIEILVTVTLFVLIVSLTVANVSFLHKSVASSEIDKLYSICRYLQRCAMLSGKKQELVFDTIHSTYSFNGCIETLPSHVKFDVISQIKGPPSSPSHYITSPITFKSSKIIFYPDGIIQSGTVYLTDNHNNCLYALSSSVAHVSYLRKYSYNGKWTLL